MEEKLQLEIPLLLPDVPDEKDQCITRLLERIKYYKGIQKAHIDQRDGDTCFCLHYDPDQLSLSNVRRLAEQEGANITNRYHHRTLHITDMDCGDCASSIEHILNRMPGIINAAVNYAAEKMNVEFDRQKIAQDQIIKKVRQLGYTVEEERKEKGWIQTHWELILAALCGVFLATGFAGEMVLGFAKPISIAFYILTYLTGGYNAARHGVKAAMHFRFDVDFLMVVAALGAAVLGKWAEGGILLFLFSLGHGLEHYATDKARNAIRALGKITPKTAMAIRDGQETEIAVDKLLRGDRVIVKPGARIPIDGKIQQGFSAIDESPITGESVPVEKQQDDPVFAGTVNGDGALEIVVTKLAKDTTLARIVEMVEEAQMRKSPTQRFTERFERIFVPIILGIVLLVISLPPLLGWLNWEVAFLRAMAVLVASSPCALAIATPSSVLSAIARAARSGVLIKGGVYLEKLGRIKAVAFDKTGTITEGKLQVTDIIPFGAATQEELLQYAASVENRSDHPLARAIVHKARIDALQIAEAASLQSFSGLGIQAEITGKEITIGNLKMFNDKLSAAIPEDISSKVRELERAGKTTVLVKAEDRFLGIIALADQPRQNLKMTLDKLKRLGIASLVMITGDNDRVAAAISRQLGFDQYKADLLPEQKVDAIKQLILEHGEVAMIGDGVNDAPALVNASVGIAMGASGTDVALETADVALMADDLSRLPFAIALSRQSRRIILQNLIIALGVIALLIPATLFGLAGIALAIIFHEGSTLVVVANGLRLLKFQVYQK